MAALLAFGAVGVWQAPSALAGVPVPTTGASAFRTDTSAKVAGKVDSNGLDTTSFFEYGTTPSYGLQTASRRDGISQGSVVTAPLNGLESGTVYHYRLTATNSDGTGYGKDRTFMTTGTAPAPGAAQPANVATGAIENLRATMATITGTVDPNARATNVYAEYGLTEAYGSRSEPTSVGSGETGVPVRINVTGLRPAQTYHYRLVATNDLGVVTGADREFSTRSINTVRLTTGSKLVIYGQPLTLSVGLSGSGIANQRVTVLSSPFPFRTAFTLAAPETSATNAGNASFVLRSVRVTSQFKAASTFASGAVTSDPVTVKVIPAVTLKVVRVPGRRLSFAGLIRPAGGATVTLQRLGSNGRAITVKRVRVVGTTKSSVRYTIKISRRPGRYRVTVKPNTTRLGSATTAPITVTA